MEKGMHSKYTLLIGIGNSARSDDGLGWEFLDRIRKFGIFHGDIVYKYQLQVEDADMIKTYDHVIFVDAYKTDEDIACIWKECTITDELGFSTHALEPESVISLCHSLFPKTPKSYILGIKGYHWELKEGISKKALENLDQSIELFKSKLSESEVSNKDFVMI